MPTKKYIVDLTIEERSKLIEIINAKRMAAHKRKHAQMLLKIDQGPQGPGWIDARVADTFDCTARTSERLRRRFVERGFDAALAHGNRGSHKARKFDGVAEAHLIALACGDPPEGRRRWTVRLLADQIVALNIVDSCGKSTVHDTLKKMSLSLT